MSQEVRWRITANTGFVTNSSSSVSFFKRELLEDPDVKAFMKAFRLAGGVIGENLWDRGECASILLTQEQQRLAAQNLGRGDWGSPDIHCGEDEFVVIYGDEYETPVSVLHDILAEKMRELGLGSYHSTEYN